MPTIERGDTQIVWEEQGDGEPLLLIMGHGWPRQMWARHLPALTNRFRVITFDNRGVGETVTAAKSWTIQDMAADAVAVLDAAGVDRAHVYGVSMGGGIAQVVALEYPQRVGSLILGCTAPEGARRRFAVLKLLPRLVPTLLSGKEARLMAVGRAMVYGPATDRARILEDIRLLESLNRPADGIKAQGEAVAGYEGSRPRLHEITSPTLVIHGDHDRLVDIRYGRALADGIRGARMVTLPGAGHMYLTDSGAAADDAVVSFLGDHPLRPA